MILRLTIGFFIFWFSLAEANDIMKSYTKDYYSNGKIKSEGWSLGTKKIKYWKFYHPNGRLASKGHFTNNQKTGYWYFFREDGSLDREGHYINNAAEKWWIFYDIAGRNKEKVELQNNQRNGYCLIYEGRKLIRVKKYNNNAIIGEWTDKKSFKRDNPEIKFTAFGILL